MSNEALRTRALRSRLSPLLAGLSFAAVASLAAPASAGGAADAVHVSVTAPAGEGCISSEALEKAVRKRVSGSPRRTVVDVVIESASPEQGWKADVAVTGRAGRRSVRTRSASCDRLDEGLVLVVTLLVDPDGNDDEAPAAPASKDEPETSWGMEEPAEEKPAPKARQVSEPDPADDPESDSALAKRRRGDRRAAKEKPSPEKDRSKDRDEEAQGTDNRARFGLTAGMVYSTGLAKEGLLGGRGAISFLSPTPVPLEASFTLLDDSDEPLNRNTASAWRHVVIMSWGLLGCPATLDVGRLHFGGCAGLTVTRLQSTVDANYTVPMPEGTPGSFEPLIYSADDIVVSPTADLRFDVSLTRFLRLGVGLEMMVPINRPSEPTFADADLQAAAAVPALTDPVAFQPRIGLTLVLPP